MTTIFITGTGTEIGKTWVAVELVAELRRRGHPVSARKPAQSFGSDERGTTDAELLAAATGETPTAVCPPHRWYETPMAPPMAATALEQPAFTIADLAAETIVSTAGITFVEGAGGPRSPIAADGDNVDLARVIGVDLIVLVADAGLGTINAVELSTHAFHDSETLVFLNWFNPHQDLHRRNLEWLAGAGHRIATAVEALADAIEQRVSQF